MCRCFLLCEAHSRHLRRRDTVREVSSTACASSTPSNDNGLQNGHLRARQAAQATRSSPELVELAQPLILLRLEALAGRGLTIVPKCAVGGRGSSAARTRWVGTIRRRWGAVVAYVVGSQVALNH